ncbi:PKD domain-containing protein [Flaviaesturariibacter amylovorans]|uniref:PKD domain-containing protein n=1 Tax=Flaviaesturariibacter amylovorans TaxID=1084520 RepID=A0ABP8HQG7_9BACT
MKQCYLLFLCLLAVLGVRAQSGDSAAFTPYSTNNNFFFHNTSHVNDSNSKRAYWFFGDGTMATTAATHSVNHSYTSPGTYSVCLRIYSISPVTQDTIAQTAATCRLVVVGPDSCGGNFQVTRFSGDAPLQRRFLEQPWSSNNRQLVSACWNFGDGTSVPCMPQVFGNWSTTHTYAQPGTYNACLTMTYEGGCQKQVCRTLTVVDSTAGLPDSCRSVLFNAPLVSNPLAQLFYASTWHSRGKIANKVCYSFGDGRDTCILYPNGYQGNTINHTYPGYGTYNACVTVTYEGGCVSTNCRQVVIAPPPPPADSCRVNLTVQQGPGNTAPYTLTASAQPWHNFQKPVRKVCWSWGDNSPVQCDSSNTSTPPALQATHVYNQNGTYNICVTVTYEGGCQTTMCRTVQLPAPGPTDSCRADFGTTAMAGNPRGRNFTALPWHNGQKPVTKVCWTFGDGRDTCINYPNGYNGAAIPHTYNQNGNYNACVTITYQGGCVSTFCRVVTIQGAADSCATDHSNIRPAGAGPLHRQFAFQAAHNNNRPATQLLWNWGDGSVSTFSSNLVPGQYNYGHTYAAAGTYNVCLTTMYDGGCQAQRCRLVTITDSTVNVPDSCRADFHWSISAANPRGRVVNFGALPWHNRQKPVTQVCYTFGDGRDTCVQYPNGYNGAIIPHIYPGAGTYNACVTLTYQGGCVSQSCHTVTIPPPAADSCRASFFTTSMPGAPLTRQFTAVPWHNNSKHVTKVCWAFGDGRDTCINYSATTPEPYRAPHTYAQYGTYTVCVTITYDGGCVSTTCHTVTLMPTPPPPANDTTCFAGYTVLPTQTATPLLREFRALPQSTRRPVRLRWFFGDGTDTTVQLPNPVTVASLVVPHRYTQYGNYQACLRIEYENGCAAQTCRYIQVQPILSCTATIRDSLVAPRTVRFEGGALLMPGDTVVSWRWTFGDGTSANVQNPVHAYVNGGTYYACLTVRTARGCEARLCRSVTIQAPGQTTLVLMPNPVSTTLHAVFYSLYAQQVTVRIVNASGLVVRQGTRYAWSGINNWDYGVSTLPTGYYTFVVQSPNQYITKHFFKQ